MIIEAGKLNVTVPVYFVDDVSGTATGEGTTGLLFSDIETGGSGSYQRQGAARVDFQLFTQTVAGGHTDGGFIQIDATNMPGLYRLDVPDAAFATGVDFVIIQLVADSSNDTLMRPIIVDLSPAINLVAIQGGAVPTPTTTGILDVNVERWLDTLVTLSAGAPDVNIQSTDDIALSTTQKADVNTEVLDVMSVDTFTELSQGVPSATPTHRDALMLIYMALRNRLDIDTSGSPDHKEIYNDANVVITKKVLTDDGSIYREDKMITGP